MSNGKPSSQVIAFTVLELLSSDTWVPLSEVLKKALSKLSRGNFSQDKIEEIVEEEEEHVAEILQLKQSEGINDGVAMSFQIDSEPKAYIKSLSARRLPLLNRLRSATPKSFENVCGEILSAMSKEVSVIGQPSDGGVDFFSWNFFKFGLNLPIPRCCNAMVLGQAKRYQENNCVKEKEVREFVGGAIRKANELKKERHIGPLTPIIYAFWTTSDFHQTALEYSRHLGIWHLNGIGILEYIDKLSLENKIEQIIS